MSITLKQNVWTAKEADVTHAMQFPDTASFHYFTESIFDWAGYGYTKIGVATITIETLPFEDILKGRMDAIKAEEAACSTAYAEKMASLKEEKAKLLAIAYEQPPTIVNALAEGANGTSADDFKDIPF